MHTDFVMCFNIGLKLKKNKQTKQTKQAWLYCFVSVVSEFGHQRALCVRSTTGLKPEMRLYRCVNRWWEMVCLCNLWLLCVSGLLRYNLHRHGCCRDGQESLEAEPCWRGTGARCLLHFSLLVAPNTPRQAAWGWGEWHGDLGYTSTKTDMGELKWRPGCRCRCTKEKHPDIMSWM